MSKQAKTIILPLIAALIWGGAFLAQGSVTDRLGPFTMNALRSFIAFVCLFFVSFISDERKIKKSVEMRRPDMKLFVIGSVVCGIMLFLGSNLQQFALAGNLDGSITEGEVAFITAFYMILVPVFGIFFKRKTGVNVWIAVVIALVGLYLICVNGKGFSINKYVIFAISNAVAYTFHILAIDHYASEINPIKLSCGQFFVNFFLSSIFALLFENISLAAIADCALPLFYIGIFSSTIAFTLQIVAQQEGNPTVVSILMCTESGFALLLQTIIGIINPEKAAFLSVRQYIGCAVMFIAVVVAQINFNIKIRKAH